MIHTGYENYLIENGWECDNTDAISSLGTVGRLFTKDGNRILTNLCSKFNVKTGVKSPTQYMIIGINGILNQPIPMPSNYEEFNQKHLIPCH